ncbi:MAG: RNA methyltransferase [Parcubacteria group bacterium CG11_big_fil_rev_8_21_14_0_20_39_22]|nr:MAG: RNA methyltransferase [Parcubacteria group bacterium CG11_big_fil_rev_8_21_14_0_20_39_22]
MNRVKSRVKKGNNMVLVLVDIRSVHNVGSLFRTAEAAGVEKIYLTGITPSPLDRFGRKRKDLAKVSLGTEEYIKWEYCDSVQQVLIKLESDGFEIVAIEQHKDSIDYRDFKIEGSTAFLLGSETDGLSAETLKKVSHIIEIPLKGKKESLNVSVAGGVVLFKVLDYRPHSFE